MKNPRALILAAAVALGALTVADRAEAVVHAGVYGGVQHFGQPGTYAMARAEGSVGVVPWFHLGGYAQLLEGLGRAEGGWGAGAIAALRPQIPGFKVDPMAFATLGYQRVGAGDGLTVELGGGLAWHVAEVLDIELRGAWVNIASSGAPSGFHATLGLSLVL